MTEQNKDTIMINDNKTIDTLIVLLKDEDTPLYSKRHIREAIITLLSINNSTFEYAWKKVSGAEKVSGG